MAPTKRKLPGSRGKAGQEDGTVLRDFFSNEARSAFRGLIRRTVIPERGINNTPPFDAYIKKHGWEALTQTPVDANMTMANEFYANFRHRDEAGNILCRGKMVQLSPESINEYYRLRTNQTLYREYKKLSSEVRCDDGELVGPWSDIVRGVTQEKYGMDEILPKQRWGSIDKKYLTTEMNVWYGFVATRLLPVTINSEVQWERLRLLYAIKHNMAINVGLTIFGAMVFMSNSSACLGFHSLITGLCHRAGCEDRIDDSWKQPKGMLTYEAFHRRVHNIVRPPKPLAPPSSSAGMTLDSVGVLLHEHGDRLDRIEDYMRRICENTAAIVAQGSSVDVINVLPTSVALADGGGCRKDEAQVGADTVGNQGGQPKVGRVHIDDAEQQVQKNDVSAG